LSSLADVPAALVLQTIAGFLLLLGGAEMLVRGSVAIARRMEISTMVIGMTVVAFGTSAPELIVSLEAALSGAPGIAVGNIVGSNIANVLLIIGLTALCMPITPQARPLMRDALSLVGASLMFAVLMGSGSISILEGGVLLLVFVVFMVTSYRRGLRGDAGATAQSLEQEAAEMGELPAGTWLLWVGALAGLVGLCIGSSLLVDGGIGIARLLGVSEVVIGLTMIAVGTSLPELAASVAASLHRHPDVVVGNVLGSNLFNMLFVGGTVAVARPLPIEEKMLAVDIWIMLAATILFLPVLLGCRFGRGAGVLFLVLYGGYIAIQFRGDGSPLTG
jgi:cation:H+ antiporter